MMQQNSILLENINSDGLKILIQEAVKTELTAIPLKHETHYLTRAQVCEVLHLSLPTVDKAIADGRLKAYRIGGRILFKEEELILKEIPKKKHR
jgi:excisionase family DNA binding protein